MNITYVTFFCCPENSDPWTPYLQVRTRECVCRSTIVGDVAAAGRCVDHVVAGAKCNGYLNTYSLTLAWDKCVSQNIALSFVE